MRWLLAASLMAGVMVVPATAQRAVSAGHAGGFSAPHGFAPPHISGGFSAGSHFSPSPVMNQRNFSASPQYHQSTPARYSGGQTSYLPNRDRNTGPDCDRHQGRPPYPGSHYRQPYVPYFYANSAYLVPGLVNSYGDYPESSHSGDQSDSTSQAQAESNGDYEPESVPYETQQAQDVPPPPPGPAEPLPQAAITLVFKDGHSQEIRNYAMTKTALYVLDDAASGRRPEILLDQIDISATERTNQQAGVDFIVPTGAE